VMVSTVKAVRGAAVQGTAQYGSQGLV